ncbi:hypothetical protein [Hymenobacter wooponensis]|uniref:Uncharacterized protein n=1 Tax=Hymenobacter wooponensis TaxID=1525360 RepID=A0A4Z0MCB2_9BACT|nr:hypothetical protein [Hymenobacter wooponensis]TGD77134.1 hypothetical protein EU557_24175 [Hymenobacter wooponensis]
MPNPPKSVGLFRKFVSTARSITTGQVSIPLGVRRLDKHLYWLSDYNIKPLNDAEVATVKEYCALIREFPIEQERNYWAPGVLKEIDERLDQITAKYQPELMNILLRIVTEAPASNYSA